MKRPQKFETITHLIWHLLSKSQIKWEIVSKFVAFLENLNFTTFDFPILNSDSFSGMSKDYFVLLLFISKQSLHWTSPKIGIHNWWKGDWSKAYNIRVSGYIYVFWWPVFTLIFILRNVNRVHDIFIHFFQTY